MTTPRPIARAETVGSLLRPPELLAARREFEAGRVTRERVRELEDAAVLDAIRLQESAGLDVITDGEMRRGGWTVTTEALDGFEPREGGPGLTWHDQHGTFSQPIVQAAGGYPTVVRPIAPRRDLTEEYAFLARHARVRTKYCMPAPSYHRRFWYREHSSAAYPTCEEFLIAVRDYQRAVLTRLIELGCDYVQLDAPNYGTLCDRDNRRMLEARGHDLEAELAFDVELDSSLFDGFEGITRALHVCRGNAAGRWHSSGGYGVIAEQLFPKLRVDVLLLEYDSERAGGFEPLACIPPGTIAVLGLLTTKSGAVEEEAVIERRIQEAARVKPLEELALSPQCGFASVAVGNPVTPEQQRAKLELVGRVAHRIWG
ncbi:MAG TPA: cobalamin-independent methionine synthase II family protein [Candidatus Dormibacteraeota bacterium]|nr:cobalamin-independent methionine synthase II family protein [Candidatus Dormibacteraeota bacterium]